MMNLKNIYNRGLINYKNTHLLSRELHSREYVFSHNGIFRNTYHLAAHHFKPLRTTDSAILFCNFLYWMKENEITALNTDALDETQEHQIVINELQSVGGFPSEVNCLIFEDETLFCYADIFKRGLFFLNKHQGYSCCGKMLLDSDCDISFEVDKESRQSVHSSSTRKMAEESEKIGMLESQRSGLHIILGDRVIVKKDTKLWSQL